MSPPVIILSDSDDAPPASSHITTITLSDVTLPISPAIPSVVPSGNASGETEPFEEGEATSTPLDSFADGPLYRPLIGPMTYDQYLYDKYLESQQFLPADDVPSPPFSPLPIVSQPHMPPAFTPSLSSGDSPFPIPPPTVFYTQTTTVPVSSPISPPVSSPMRTQSAPLPSRKRARHMSPSSSDPYVQAATEAATHPRVHRRVDARRWSFLLECIRRWRREEGAPRASELGESSSAVLPVTGEPIHHTVPLLAARLARHEDRIDELLSLIDDISLERVENMQDELVSLVVHSLAMEEALELIGIYLEETEETVTDLVHRLDSRSSEAQEARDMVVMMQQRLDHQAEELAAANSTIHALRSTIGEMQTRERSRDQRMEELTEIVRGLQRGPGDAPSTS